MLVIGGHDGATFFNDIFKLVLDTGTWTQITIKATVPRMAYHDAVRVGRNILIYGGQRKSGGFIKEMWKVRGLPSWNNTLLLTATRSSCWTASKAKRSFGRRSVAKARLLSEADML
jgi:hypothetical protein